MNYLKKWILPGFTGVIAGLLSFQIALAGDIISNDLSFNEILKLRKVMDDPTPVYKKVNYMKDWVTQETWDKITSDPKEAGKAWEKVRGFKAPDVTGIIAPEIKPGKYTLADKERLPFKELMPPGLYARFNEPGGQGGNAHPGRCGRHDANTNHKRGPGHDFRVLDGQRRKGIYGRRKLFCIQLYS